MDRSRTNICLPQPPLIGRDAELNAVTAQVEQHSLVTIFGTAGLGKTRLSKHVAARWLDAADARAAFFVDWSCADDRAGMLWAAHDACGLTGTPSVDLVHQLSDRPTLLVLDNLEHVIDEAWELVSGWLSTGTPLTIVTTSRERLGTTEERVFKLQPLAIPPVDDPGRGFDAVELFIERATAANEAFDPTGRVEAIAEIVRRLDGLPLAIELAAQRTTLLEPDEIAARLQERFALLSHGARGAVPRQATLHGALDWSWNLLNEAERRVMAQTSIFRAPFSVGDAAEVVNLDSITAMDALQRLVDKSLLRREVVGLVYFESVREFARQRLSERDDADDVITRHVRWAESDGASVEDAVVALRATLQDDALVESGVRIVQRLGDVLLSRGVDDARMSLVAEAVDRASTRLAGTSELLATSLRVRGNLRRIRGELDDAIADLGRAVDALPDSGGARGDLGIALHESGDRHGAEACYEVALARLQEVGDVTGAARMVGSLAILRHEQRAMQEARTSYEQALATFRRAGDQRSEAAFCCNLGDLYRETDRPDDARAYYQQAVDIGREIEDRRIQGVAIGNLGGLAVDAGDYDAALEHRRQAAQILREAGDRRLVAVFDGYAACALHLQGKVVDALVGYRDSIRQLRELGDARYASVFALYEVVALADLGTEGMEERLRELEPRLRELGESGALTALALHARRLGIELDIAPEDGMSADEEVRFAWALAGEAGDEPVEVDPTVRVALDGSGFVTPSGDVVDLRRRSAPRFILAALAAQLVAPEPQRVEFAVDDLFEHGWPGEQVHPDHGANRVYVAIATLRNLGLRNVLILREGYLLDPAFSRVEELELT